MPSTDQPRQDFLLALGATIRRLRTLQGLTQVELAVAAGMNAQTLYRAEKGRLALNIERVIALAQALGIGTGELVALAEGAAEPCADADELALLAAWRRAPVEERTVALAVLRALSSASGGE